MESWPWRLAQLCDPRVSTGDKEDLALQFMQTPACCLPAGFARRLRLSTSSHLALLQPAFAKAMLAVARLVLMTIAGIENRHARSRRRRTEDTAFANFVSRYINEEASTLKMMRERRSQSNCVTGCAAPSSSSASVGQDAHSTPFLWGVVARETGPPLSHAGCK